jgi:hypothetical protein
MSENPQLNERIKNLFTQYLMEVDDVSSISLLSFLEFCKNKQLIFIKDKRSYLNLYLDGLRNYKGKKNFANLKNKKAKCLYNIADKLINNYNVSV